MQKGWYVVIVVVILAIIGTVIYFSAKGKDENSSGDKTENTSSTSSDTIVKDATAILFYGKGCPYCEKVEQWLTDNKVSDKVKYDSREVWYNKDNSKLLSEKADTCNIASDKVGVPFLFDIANKKCYVGETEVMDFFKGKI